MLGIVARLRATWLQESGELGRTRRFLDEVCDEITVGIALFVVARPSTMFCKLYPLFQHPPCREECALTDWVYSAHANMFEFTFHKYLKQYI